MKKNLIPKMSFLFSAMLVAALASGCGKSTDNSQTTTTTTAQPAAADNSAETETVSEAAEESTAAENSKASVETEAVESTEILANTEVLADSEIFESTEAVYGTEVLETTEIVEGTETIEYKLIGKGDTRFFFISTDSEGNSEYYEVSTDETTVGEALLALNLIAGEDSEYGLYVKTVNGVTADYDKDGTYWAFYIDGEYASTGVDSTDITPGSTYSFVVEK